MENKIAKLQFSIGGPYNKFKKEEKSKVCIYHDWQHTAMVDIAQAGQQVQYYEVFLLVISCLMRAEEMIGNQWFDKMVQMNTADPNQQRPFF